MTRYGGGIFVVGMVLMTGSLMAQSKPLFDFPTANHGLAEGNLPEFYMYINRDFQGEKSTPWEGGQYGFVRGPKIRNGNVVYAQMHEGIDIAPMERNAAGNPLDIIKASADGRVAYVSTEARASNYGRYLVIEHRVNGTPFLTLYAHLASISVKVGDLVRQGQPIAVMGFTGDGLDRTRAHLHFEVALLLSRNFDAWYKNYLPRDPNRHGIFNGRNIVGMNPSRFLMEARNNAQFDPRQFVMSEEPFYKIRIRNTPNFDLIKLYPWMAGAAASENPPAWTVTFSRFGVPLKIEPYALGITEPQLAWVKPSVVDYATMTKGIVTGSMTNPQLSDSGKQLAHLLTYPD